MLKSAAPLAPPTRVRLMTLPKMQAMELQQISEPFDDDDWIGEVKYDGFRAMAYIEEGVCRLVSRNDNQYTRFKKLAARIPGEIDAGNAILDGELVCLGPDGRANFYDLMFNRAEPILAVFDLLYLDGCDMRDLPLLERKESLRARLAPDSTATMNVQHIDRQCRALFQQTCDMDVEEIVAKPKISPYREVNGRSTWLKIKNPDYSQAEGRGDLFDQRQ